jgi:D-sedoheptulose 7-phosphate isomerase
MEYVKEYFQKYAEGLSKIDPAKVDAVVNILFRTWKNGNQLFIIGNGGSAVTASHMACDLGKGTLDNVHDTGIKRFRVISLTDNVATMTAIGNDIGYDHIFSQQLRNLISPGDVVLIITGSGNSPNVLEAAKTANSMGASTIGLLGFDGGKLKDLVDHHVIFEEKHYGRVEDFHLMFNHLITERLSKLMKEEKS